MERAIELSIKSVKNIVKLIIKRWGSGSIKIEKKRKFYEDTNLLVDINKAKKLLKWKPSYSIEESVNATVDWYYKILENKENPIQITNSQIDSYMNNTNW